MSSSYDDAIARIAVLWSNAKDDEQATELLMGVPPVLASALDELEKRFLGQYPGVGIVYEPDPRICVVCGSTHGEAAAAALCCTEFASGAA